MRSSCKTNHRSLTSCIAWMNWIVGCMHQRGSKTLAHTLPGEKERTELNVNWNIFVSEKISKNASNIFDWESFTKVFPPRKHNSFCDYQHMERYLTKVFVHTTNFHLLTALSNPTNCVMVIPSTRIRCISEWSMRTMCFRRLTEEELQFLWWIVTHLLLLWHTCQPAQSALVLQS